MIKDVIPCFETVFLSMARNAGAGGDVTSLNIILCADKDCVKIDCFRDKLETKALQTKNPYCPVCVGEKTLAEAMTLQVSEIYLFLREREISKASLKAYISFHVYRRMKTPNTPSS
jgi:hypothetical protein